MIVLLIKSDLIQTQSLVGQPCPHCQKTGGLIMALRQRYAEFAGGKVYPEGVFGVSHCNYCGYTIPASRWSENLHRMFVGMKADYRTPITYWKGAIRTAIGFSVGTVLLIGVLWVMGRQQRATAERDRIAVETVMNQPTPGVTLAITDGVSGLFDVWRVGRVDVNTVWLRKYVGDRKLANFYTETGWNALSDADFEGEGTAFSKQVFAKKGLKRVENLPNKTSSYEGYVMAVLK